ncbi:MAG: hypothetical protein WC475_04230 [Candidatus Paceibacterota bacterium]
MKNINIPDRIFGQDIKGAMKKVLGEENKKQSLPQQNQPQNAPNLDGFIYVPSVDLYFQKEKQSGDNNWVRAHERLRGQGLRMPTIEEFRQFLIYLRSNSNYENNAIYNEITEFVVPWRSEWLDAYFVNQDGFYIQTQNRSRGEPLEQCLMEDKSSEIVGIDFDEWLNDATKQGLPKPNIKKGHMSYLKPVDGGVTWFRAGPGGAGLNCGRYSSLTSFIVGVRGVLENGAPQKI